VSSCPECLPKGSPTQGISLNQWRCKIYCHPHEPASKQLRSFRRLDFNLPSEFVDSNRSSCLSWSLIHSKSTCHLSWAVIHPRPTLNAGIYMQFSAGSVPASTHQEFPKKSWTNLWRRCRRISQESAMRPAHLSSVEASRLHSCEKRPIGVFVWSFTI